MHGDAALHLSSYLNTACCDWSQGFILCYCLLFLLTRLSIVMPFGIFPFECLFLFSYLWTVGSVWSNFCKKLGACNNCVEM